MEDEFLELIPSNSRVEDHVLEAADVEEIKEAIYQLSENDRDILMMRFFREMSDAEISKELGILPATARVRTSRARKHLIKLLERREAGL